MMALKRERERESRERPMPSTTQKCLRKFLMDFTTCKSGTCGVMMILMILFLDSVPWEAEDIRQ